jgi:hypothetical protein
MELHRTILFRDASSYRLRSMSGRAFAVAPDRRPAAAVPGSARA